MGALTIAATRARKSAGRYDTPAALSQLVVRLGLEARLDEAMRASDPRADVLALRVCDPTCGEGNLLVEAARYLTDRLRVREADSPRDALAREVVRRCIRGVERDPAVAARCRLALSHFANLDAPPPWLDETIVTDDAASIACASRWNTVFADEMARGGFDAVIGNPPFLNAIERRAATTTRTALRVLHPELGATADVAFHFFAIAASLRHPRGRVSMVTPRALLSAPSAEGLRARLAADVRALYAPDSARLFEGAHVFVSVVALGAGEGCVGSLDRDPSTLTWQPITLRDGAWWAALHGENLSLPSEGATSLGERFEVSASMTAGEAYELADRLVDDRDGAGLALVTTGLVDRGCCHWGARPCRYLGRNLTHPRVDPSKPLSASLARRIARAKRPKVIVAGLGRVLESFVDASGIYLGAVSTWTITDPRDDVAALHALVTHLHSTEVDARLRAALGATALGGGSVTLTRRFLDAIPLPSSSV
jgi:N-6 DNA Methylase